MKFKICIILLFLSYGLSASDQYVSVRTQRSSFLASSEDVRIATLTACALGLDDPKLDRAGLKKYRKNLMTHYEAASESDTILQVLNQIKENHKRRILNPFGIVFSSTINKERVDLKRVVVERMSAEERADNQINMQGSMIVGSAPVVATAVNYNNNK